MTDFFARIKALGQCRQVSVWDEVENEIAEIRRQIACLDACFDMIGDADLIDSLIYQRSGLLARYEYLLKQAKVHKLVSNKIRIST